jgi:hypothetical protein
MAISDRHYKPSPSPSVREILPKKKSMRRVALLSLCCDLQKKQRRFS